MLHFLRLDFWKIALTCLLLVLSSMLWRMFVISRISDTFPMGFPLQFYLAWGPCQAGENCSESNGAFLVLDALFWYMISAWIVERIRKRQ